MADKNCKCCTQTTSTMYRIDQIDMITGREYNDDVYICSYCYTKGIQPWLSGNSMIVTNEEWNRR